MAGLKEFRVTISKVDGPAYDDNAVSVTVPGVSGEMTLLPGHEPLISPLKAGVITVRTPALEKKFEIESGTLECSNDQVTILI